jgi:hypothetical protein
MKRSVPRNVTLRPMHVGFVLLACIGIGVLPVRAADPEAGMRAGTRSTYTLKIINDTRSHIDSFSIAPFGTDRWTSVDFRVPVQESSFDYGFAVMLQLHDDGGCVRNLRTVLSDGRRIATNHFDICHGHAYRPGADIF